MYNAGDFGRTVRADYERRSGDVLHASAKEASSSGGVALGHPHFADLAIGESRSVPIACVFLDLTDFTGRTFWDGAEETSRLAHAVSTGFIGAVTQLGGFPLGLRGDGLFAAFGPGNRDLDVFASLAACAMALQGVRDEVNPWLKRAGKAPVLARAGADYGEVTFVRSGNDSNSEVNQIGFAANFAAKCEKHADSWEVVIGQTMAESISNRSLLTAHPKSPKRYTRDYETRAYSFYDYKWAGLLPLLPALATQINGTPTTKITVG